MGIAQEDVPVRIDVPGTIGRQQMNFGDSTGYDKIRCEYFSLSEGADITELLKGLEGDLCQCPHWSYVLSGSLTVSYADGSKENPGTNDLFYWPPVYTVKAEKNTEMILFSPQHEHSMVIDHILAKVQG